jgi:leucyl-tRNA synthetase
MAYCNGGLHLGHLHVLTQLSARAYLSNNADLIFPYHVSGLPAVLFYEKLKTGEKDVLEQFNNFTENKMDVNDIKTIEDWFNVVRTTNDDIIKHFDFPVKFENTHYTAYIEPMYDSMVEAIFEILKSKDLLYSGIYPVLYCRSCDTVVGDHDLSKGESVTIVTKILNVQKLDKRINFCKEGNLYYNKTLDEQWLLNMLFYESFKDVYELIFITVESIDDYAPNAEIEYNVLSLSAYCRCGMHIGIKKIQQSFIAYNNENWKILTKNYIKNMTLNHHTVSEILNRIDSLRGWPILRNRGIGTQYEGKVIDSLSDSTLFPVYSVLKPFLDSIQPFVNKQFWIQFFLKQNSSIYVQKALDYFQKYVSRYWLEASGKDLINNHLTFILYFMALFQLPYHELIVTGHILNAGEKMSKSLNNVITGSSLKNILKGTQLRYLLLTLAEREEDGNWTNRHIKEGLQTLNKLYKWRELLQLKRVEYSIFDDLLEHELDKLINITTNAITQNKFRTFFHQLNSFLNIHQYWINVLNGENIVSKLKYLFNIALSLIGEVPLNFELKQIEVNDKEDYKFWIIAKKLKRDLQKFIKLKNPSNVNVFYSKHFYNIYEPYLTSALFQNDLYNSFRVNIKIEIAPVDGIRPIFSKL